MSTLPPERTAQPREFRNAERAQHSVLTRAEKKTLAWLAARMPRWVNSDHLTALSLLAMLLAGGSYWLARYDRRGLLLVCVCLAVNWFGDSLDGTLARFRKTPRPRYGFYVDHVVDTFGALALLGGLALSGYMSPLAAAVLLIAYYILSIEVFLATYCLGTFHMSFGGLGPTELRILLAGANVWLYFTARVPMAQVFGMEVRVFDVGAMIAAAGMFAIAVATAARHIRALYQAEPIKKIAPGD
ncbi:MAG: CDP-alcohol phosphatidyltransferase family protein [Candidatus Acidiferrales bacterium]